MKKHKEYLILLILSSIITCLHIVQFLNFITGGLINSGIAFTDMLDCKESVEVYMNIGRNVNDFCMILRIMDITYELLLKFQDVIELFYLKGVQHFIFEDLVHFLKN